NPNDDGYNGVSGNEIVVLAAIDKDLDDPFLNLVNLDGTFTATAINDVESEPGKFTAVAMNKHYNQNYDNSDQVELVSTAEIIAENTDAMGNTLRDVTEMTNAMYTANPSIGDSFAVQISKLKAELLAILESGDDEATKKTNIVNLLDIQSNKDYLFDYQRDLDGRQTIANDLYDAYTAAEADRTVKGEIYTGAEYTKLKLAQMFGLSIELDAVDFDGGGPNPAISYVDIQADGSKASVANGHLKMNVRVFENKYGDDGADNHLGVIGISSPVMDFSTTAAEAWRAGVLEFNADNIEIGGGDATRKLVTLDNSFDVAEPNDILYDGGYVGYGGSDDVFLNKVNMQATMGNWFDDTEILIDSAKANFDTTGSDDGFNNFISNNIEGATSYNIGSAMEIEIEGDEEIVEGKDFMGNIQFDGLTLNKFGTISTYGHIYLNDFSTASRSGGVSELNINTGPSEGEAMAAFDTGKEAASVYIKRKLIGGSLDLGSVLSLGDINIIAPDIGTSFEPPNGPETYVMTLADGTEIRNVNDPYNYAWKNQDGSDNNNYNDFWGVDGVGVTEDLNGFYEGNIKPEHNINGFVNADFVDDMGHSVRKGAINGNGPSGGTTTYNKIGAARGTAVNIYGDLNVKDYWEDIVEVDVSEKFNNLLQQKLADIAPALANDKSVAEIEENSASIFFTNSGGSSFTGLGTNAGGSGTSIAGGDTTSDSISGMDDIMPVGDFEPSEE
ncbi:MAG: hypothetical protein ACOCUV_00570, partial [bacterium]